MVTEKFTTTFVPLVSSVVKIRLMQLAEIAADRGYKRRQQYHQGEVATIAPNLLNREFTVDKRVLPRLHGRL